MCLHTVHRRQLDRLALFQAQRLNTRPQDKLLPGPSLKEAPRIPLLEISRLRRLSVRHLNTTTQQHRPTHCSLSSAQTRSRQQPNPPHTTEHPSQNTNMVSPLEACDAVESQPRGRGAVGLHPSSGLNELTIPSTTGRLPYRRAGLRVQGGLLPLCKLCDVPF